MILAFLGQSVKEYETGFMQLLDKLSLFCTICHGACNYHAWCERKARTGEGTCILKLPRVRCGSCRHTHLVLPDFLRPYGRYTQHVRQKAVLACLEGVPAEKAAVCGQAVETVRRWVARFKEDVEKAAAALRSLLARWGRFPPLGRSSLKDLTGSCLEAAGSMAFSCLFGLADILLGLVGLPVWL